MTDYATVNRSNWDSRVPHHVNAYDFDSFTANPEHLSPVVQFGLPRLGTVAGLDVVHLQCQIGTDTLSLFRLGARSVTGLDFSRPALDAAARLAADCEARINFVESELYGATEALGSSSFDLVYTGLGAIEWLPDIRRWAETVSVLLRPGGRLFMREFHPVLWTLSDSRTDDLLVIEYPYFQSEGLHFSEDHSYVDHDEPLASPDIIHFNHGIAKVIAALINAGMHLTFIEEHETAPGRPLGDAMEDIGGGEYRLRRNPDRLPVSYTLQAAKGG